MRIAKLAPWAVAGSSLLLAIVSACSNDAAARTCTVNADCASGLCRGDGTCAPNDSDSGTGDETSVSSTGDDASTSNGDANASDDADTTPLLDSGLCNANQDGIITVDEVPLRAGLKGTYRVTTSGVKVNTAGVSANGDAGGDAGTHRTWDFSAALTGDHTMVLETLALTGQWFANDYAGANYAARLSDSTDTLGVFATTANALELRGVVAPAAGSSSLEVKYDPAIPTLAFPLQLGKKWEVTSTASGTIPVTYNIPYTEKYTFEVDAEGELTTSTSLNPFKVLRIAIVVARTPTGSLISYYTRQYVWVAECFGSIAKAVSTADSLTEPAAEFTDVSEIQRLSP